jgi:UMF1 family MFS transporter
MAESSCRAMDRAPGPSQPQATSYPRSWLVAWCLYDWGSSAYPAIVLSFVFAPYFTEHVAPDSITGTILWGNAMTVSAIVIAVLSPVLGAFCDKGGRRKAWLFGCTSVAVVAVASLWFVRPDPVVVLMAIVLVVASNTFFELGYVFYNGMLPSIVAPREIGRASGWGWGVGYIGSLASMAATWFVLMRTNGADLGLRHDEFEHLRAAALLAAGWFAVFALPLFVIVPDRPGTGLSAREIVRSGLGELTRTIGILREHRSTAWYLAAHMVYIDGLNTLFTFAPIYAAARFGLSEAELLMFGVGVYVCAGVGSIAFAWVDDWIGARPVLLGSLAAIIVLCAATLLTAEKKYFIAVALLLSVFLGPVQAASRSLMARLSPPALQNQMFGLYALAGRATAPLGPLLVTWLVAMTSSQRAGLAVVVALLAIGAGLMLPVREPRA